MAMEFVKGELLESSVHAGLAWPAERVFEIGAQIASALEVIHGDQGNVEGECKGFGGGQPDDECSDKSRPRGHGDGVEIRSGGPCPSQCFVDHG